MMRSNGWNLALILIVIILCAFLHFIVNGPISKEGFSIPSIEIVVARYNEPLDWISHSPFNKYNIIVYNKSNNDDFAKPPNVTRIVKLDNVGRESHSYLYHIVSNYDNLSDITIFFPGSGDMIHKQQKINKIMELVESKRTAVFLSESNGEHIKTQFNDFQINEYQSSNHSNKSKNGETQLEPASIKPFGK
jgi:hypothetical protein